ncbi:hypothetical protein PNIG_a6000 [Pseudoalteromonas nigrifaciens]|uniref:Uncharacterized protein n=1 Tax=Pseudoalteromonas nigrifaciens TaxID=28109 RepID=A0AAC9UFM9_9GAMM|nr:hypothetical protein PNIG_a6000 [Pseudoalteromonas nigrifaciens]
MNNYLLALCNSFLANKAPEQRARLTLNGEMY